MNTFHKLTSSLAIAITCSGQLALADVTAPDKTQPAPARADHPPTLADYTESEWKELPIKKHVRSPLTITRLQKSDKSGMSSERLILDPKVDGHKVQTCNSTNCPPVHIKITQSGKQCNISAEPNYYIINPQNGPQHLHWQVDTPNFQLHKDIKNFVIDKNDPNNYITDLGFDTLPNGSPDYTRLHATDIHNNGTESVITLWYTFKLQYRLPQGACDGIEHDPVIYNY